MGINIYLRVGEDNHPDWDSARYAGDRDFGKLTGSLPCEVKTVGHPYDCEVAIRPKDFEVWRNAIAKQEWPNPGRLERLLAILEANPDCWMELIY